jgi:2-oxoglutarate dehydrogenase E1 component
MYAQFQDDPGSVPAEWQAFFGDLKDDPEQSARTAAGASWERDNWPVQAEWRAGLGARRQLG